MNDLPLLDAVFLGNALARWAMAAGVAVAFWLALVLFKRVVVRRLEWLAERTSTAIDNSLVDALGRVKLRLWILPGLYAGSQLLELPARAETILAALSMLSLMLQAGLLGSRLVEFWSRHSHKGSDASDLATSSSMGALRFIGKLLLWSVLLLLALDNLGIDVTAAVAGLGIGGIAVALAVQNVLGDLFASLSIVVDKPFEIGDFVVVDDYSGSVEAIGLKTTRLRSVNGEQIVFSNSDLLQARLRNYKRMFRRRVVFKFGVVCQTPPAVLETIPPLLRGIIEGMQDVQFDRAHFFTFAASAYEFEVVYWVLDPGYNLYADRQQAINLAMLRAFIERDIQLAYPTQALYLTRLPKDA